jgi:hypothetical protein
VTTASGNTSSISCSLDSSLQRLWHCTSLVALIVIRGGAAADIYVFEVLRTCVLPMMVSWPAQAAVAVVDVLLLLQRSNHRPQRSNLVLCCLLLVTRRPKESFSRPGVDGR